VRLVSALGRKPTLAEGLLGWKTGHHFFRRITGNQSPRRNRRIIPRRINRSTSPRRLASDLKCRTARHMTNRPQLALAAKAVPPSMGWLCTGASSLKNMNGRIGTTIPRSETGFEFDAMSLSTSSVIFRSGRKSSSFDSKIAEFANVRNGSKADLSG
jgi:hypothetical protein